MVNVMGHLTVGLDGRSIRRVAFPFPQGKPFGLQPPHRHSFFSLSFFVQAKMKWTSALPVAVLALPCHGYQPLARSPAPPPPPGSSQCKCSPVDPCWPSTAQWSSLNQTVGGRLIRVIPPAAVCYPSFNGIPTADPAKCAEITEQWSNSTWMYVRPLCSFPFLLPLPFLPLSFPCRDRH